MILGLSIDGTLGSGMVSPDGWRDSIGAAIGLRPPDVPIDQKDRKMMGIHSGWLTVTPTFCKNKIFCANRSAYKIIVLVKNFQKK
jgi:hypothetical protein